MDNYTLSEKIDYSSKLLKKYHDRIPVIVEKNEHIDLENYKYLLPKHMNLATFLSIIRTKLNITKNQAIFTFVKSYDGYIMCPMNESIEQIYNSHRSNDNFLYLKFGIENTFG
jgi:hypothetical protein